MPLWLSQCCFFQVRPRLLTLIATIRVNAITEDENEVSLRDAGSTKERPKLDAYDMDEDTQKDIEVKEISLILFLNFRNIRKNSHSTLMFQD